jgi:uncharacterized protein (TIGR04255 family)
MPYDRPPITEAVIELRFAQPHSREVVERATRRIRKEYHREEQEELLKLQFDAKTNKTETEKSWLGMKLSSADQTDLLFYRQTTFVCSRLAPYTGWNEFSARASRGWEVWRQEAGPTQLARVGVRYINRIDIPLGRTSLLRVEDYLNVSPRSPDELGEPMSSYTIQVVRPLGVDDCGLTLSSGTVPSPLVGFVSFLLDIDVFRENDLPLRPDELWALLNKVRVHKNRVFESCITDLARGLFSK